MHIDFFILSEYNRDFCIFESLSPLKFLICKQ